MKFAEEPLDEFYRALAEEDEGKLRSLHFPHSTVFFAREAYYQHSGEWVSLQRMEEALIDEGFLEATAGFSG